MKLSKNVLVGSLATTGMILGMVAPATTAFAATTSGLVGSDNKVTPTTDLKEGQDAGVLGGKDSDLAIAYDAGDGSTVGSATATSNANVTVVSGILTLDAVPDFGFGSGASGTTVNLKSNAATGDGVDGNNEGLLQVTESRSQTPGFTLSAQLGAFKDATTSDAVTTTSAFNLNLPKQGLVNAKGENIGKVGDQYTTGNVVSTGNDTSKTNIDGAATDVMDVSGDYTTGPISASYKDANSASLDIANGIGDGTAPGTAQSLKSEITWTLTAKPSTNAATPKA
ncbi:WxL domain-containing protein [Companilactobacillus allii]|uniref:WxL domain-containing protein n=1 Tax=Companilactobacillus allii TaxID=1847728 RepID=A0A1P8Q2C8_9LACO|nr:WxL domain-containing protein [Companilactobacillus allii]APX72032.1 hypothetical protein BTM29_05410 [Companilactobacillus allii]USQ69125.1 WxL domain-containing protein [Companilactobacillus allii]